MSSNPEDLSYLVSNFDIQKKVKHKLRIIQYKDLFEYDNLLELIPEPFSILVILINTSPSGNAHWVCLIRNGTKLIYFDSYGKGIDQELKYISKQFRKKLHETKPYLSIDIRKLMSTQGFTLEYNKIPFQKYSPNINTCGKFVVFFINSILGGKTLADIQSMLKQLKASNSTMTYDDIVNYFYNNY